MVAIPLILTAVSTAVGVVGAIQQAQAQADAANYNAEVARNNAIVAQQQALLNRQQLVREAELSAQQGSIEAARIRQRARYAQAEQINTLMSGGAGGTGSGLDLLADNATMMEMEALDAEYKTSLDLWENKNRQAASNFNAEVEKRNLLAQSELYRMEARNARRSGVFNAIGAGLSGVSSMASHFQPMPSYRSIKTSVKDTSYAYGSSS